ncbi:RepA leader peptide Tap [Yersinia enterocolitica]|nr:RepA leader peptide Tap [Yersinia enterocolitica]
MLQTAKIAALYREYSFMLRKVQYFLCLLHPCSISAGWNG